MLHDRWNMGLRLSDFQVVFLCLVNLTRMVVVPCVALSRDVDSKYIINLKLSISPGEIPFMFQAHPTGRQAQIVVASS